MNFKQAVEIVLEKRKEDKNFLGSIEDEKSPLKLPGQKRLKKPKSNTFNSIKS